MKLLRETRKGRSIEVTKYGDEAERVRDYVSVWFDHGKNPKNATYCYVLLPGATAEQTRAYAEKNSVTVLANTPQAQGSDDSRGGRDRRELLGGGPGACAPG